MSRIHAKPVFKIEHCAGKEHGSLTYVAANDFKEAIAIFVEGIRIGNKNFFESDITQITKLKAEVFYKGDAE